MRHVRKLPRPSQPVWYSIATSFTAVLVLAVGGVLYTKNVQDENDARYNRLVQQSEQKWCAIIVTLDDSYKVTPPSTPVGRKLATEMSRLRREFHC